MRQVHSRRREGGSVVRGLGQAAGTPPRMRPAAYVEAWREAFERASCFRSPPCSLRHFAAGSQTHHFIIDGTAIKVP
jgi:hypothetical protein